MNSHASNLGEQRKALPPLDPAFFEPPEMRAALAEHKISDVYRLLNDHDNGGISQHEIARRTGQSQSEKAHELDSTGLARRANPHGVEFTDTLGRPCAGDGGLVGWRQVDVGATDVDGGGSLTGQSLVPSLPPKS